MLYEEFRDPLGWINTEDEFVCSYYREDADVVPKSEVESLLDELIKEAGEIADAYKKDADKMSVSDFAKAEYRGTQIGALLVQYKIAELKNKYTEENK